MLRTPLLRLPHVMLLLSLQLSLTITRKTSDSSANSTSDAVRDAGAEIVELALGFLTFAFGVLLGTCFLEVLFAYKISLSFVKSMKVCR